MGGGQEERVRACYRQLTRQLMERGLRISTMESATAGLIASLLSDTEGASAILPGAFVTYSNEAKLRCGVPEEVIRLHSVYSLQTAAAMAEACRRFYDTHIGVGVTGTLGRPDPANPEDSVPGELYVGLCFRNGRTAAHQRRLPPKPTRYAYKLAAAEVVAEELLKCLGGINL